MTSDVAMTPKQQAVFDEWQATSPLMRGRDEPSVEAQIEQDLNDARYPSLVRREYTTLRARNEARDMLRAEDDTIDAGTFDDQYLNADQLTSLPTPDPIIDGILSRHTYAVLRGRDATFKTFIALDWALCVATGKPWQGRPVEQGRVLYIAGEGAYGIAARVEGWEYAWQTKVDPDMFTLRQSAVNMYRGGAALADLIERVDVGGYTLVVVDTLRRASGGADGNGTDMGVVVDNLEKVRRATTDGSLLALTHTDKGDNDSRGFSGIEDDADIVWHAKRDTDRNPLAVNVVNTKMKDGPDGLLVPLTMQPALDSLVVSAGSDRPDTDAILDTDRQVLTALRDVFAQTGATVNQLHEVTGLQMSTLYKCRGRLVDTPWVTLSKRGAGSYLELVPGVESPWNRDPDSTADSTPSLSAFHGDPEHDSTVFHTDSTPDSTSFHTRALPFRAGERGKRGENPDGEAS